MSDVSHRLSALNSTADRIDTVRARRGHPITQVRG